MDWNINTGYDPGDETVNFGTRAYAESDGCIYETTTVATFQSESEVSDTPALNFGYVSNGAECVCVGNSLTLFADESCQTVLLHTKFDSQIETFTCSADGNFLLVGLGNGFFHCLHIPTEGEPVYAKNLKTKPNKGRMFASIMVDESCPQDVLVVCSSGIVINFFNFNFSEIDAALSRQSDDSSEVKELTSRISFSSLCGVSSIAPVRSSTTFRWKGQLMILAVGDGFATLPTGLGCTGDLGDLKWTECATRYTLLRVESTKNKSLFLALTATGQLIYLCPYSLLMCDVPLNSKPLSDFQLVGADVSEAFVIAITVPNDPDAEHSNLIMISVSGFCEKFSLPIRFPSVLMSTTCDVEDIHFLECLRDEETTQVHTIALKGATQTVPRFRLERLLTRKKFEAAEALAKTFGLDMSLVHIARAQCILDQMQPWNQKVKHTSEENKELLNHLIGELDNIPDMDFVCNCCVSAVPPDYFVAYSLLEYAQKRLELYFVNNPELESKVAEWSGSVCASMLRLETLDLIRSCFEVEEWLEFSRADLIREVHSWIKQGALSQAAVIWSRHKSSFKSSLEDKEIVHYLLEDIPSVVPLEEVLEWLAHFLPPLLDVQPSSLPNIVAWIHAKICGLERLHPREWPKIGLDFAERTLELFSSQKVASPFLGLEVSPLRPLVVLRCALADLHTLRSKFYMHISLEDFTQDPEDVALVLVDCIDVGSISSFVTEYLNGFMLDHKLDADSIISKYIMCVLQNSVGWWHWEEAPWELRISSLLPHIINYKVRLECIVATLDDAPVPWSSLITSVAEDGLKLKHPMSSLIREKQKQVSTNLILKKYNLKTHINKIDRKLLLKFIIKQNHPDMLQDICQLSQNSSEDYIVVVMQLFNLGNMSAAIKVLRNLANDMIVKICPHLISQLSLSLEFDDDCDVENELEFLSAVTLCYDTAIKSKPLGLTHSDDLHDPVHRNSIEEIRNRYYLKRDFGKHLTKAEMGNLVNRQNALREGIQELLIEVVEDEKPTERGSRLYQRSVYVARLLMIPASSALAELVQQILDLGDVGLAAEIAGYFDDISRLPGSMYRRLSSLPCQFLSKSQTIVSGNAEVIQKASAAAYDVASKVCTHCDSGDLHGAVKSFGWAKVWNAVSGQQEVSLIGQRDAFLSWRFTPLYRDPGLVGFLNGSQLTDLLCKAFCFISDSEDHDLMSEFEPCVKKLRNDHHDLAVFMILSQLAAAASYFPQTKVYLETSKSCAAVKELVLKTSNMLLTKVAGARQLDKHVGLGLIATIGQSYALKYLQEMCKSTHFDFQRQKALAFCGVLASDMWKVRDEYNYFKQISIQSTWGSRLPELGISAKELLRENSDYDTLLHKLIGLKNVSSSLLRALCTDYHLDFQKVLLEHLSCILLSWDPNPVTTVNSDGTKDMIEENTLKELLEHCWEMQKDIEDKNLLCTTLSKMWEKINVYHHEVFIVVLEIMERHGIAKDTNKRLVITFLMSYRRIKAPDQAEEETWTQLFPSSFSLPAMSEFRLPFLRKLFDSPLSVVRKEINLNTYKNWLTIAPALDIPKDKICITAVHQTVMEEFSGNQNNMEWCGTLKNEALFESVAMSVSEMDNVEQAAATLYFFMNKVPPGLDQVDAANLCLQYSEQVFKITGDAEPKRKAEKKYFHLATLQALHHYGLGQPCYLQLVTKPHELIQTLYQHPTILDLCRGVASHSLDINSAVQEISNMYGICLKTLHLNLVTEWLQPEIIIDCNSSLDDEYFNGMSLALMRERQQKNNPDHLRGADDNILRARYVMEHGDVQEWALFLISIVFEGEASVGMRLRAMQCLCMLTDEETLVDLAGRPMNFIRNKLRSLGYIRDLEVLGLTYSESGFETCDKKELANLILRTQTFQPRAVSLLVHLCVDYNISHMSLWNSILQQLVNLAMMKELEQALSHTSEMYQLWTLPIFRKGWNLLLSSPFSKGNFSSDQEQESAMLHSLSLFPTCPVIKCIDVISALQFCLTIQRNDIAALLLPYVEKPMIPQWKEKVLSNKHSNLMDDIKKITVGKCLNVSKVLSILSININGS